MSKVANMSTEDLFRTLDKAENEKIWITDKIKECCEVKRELGNSNQIISNLEFAKSDRDRAILEISMIKEELEKRGEI